MKNNALDGLDAAKKGNMDIIEGLTGSLRGLSKDMDGIGEEWWQVVDKFISNNYTENLKIACVMGDNILFTLAKAWHPGELLNKNITGPINEQALIKYLMPGESV